MARLRNARDNHISRWVIPTAKKLLIDAICRNAPNKSLGEVAYIEMGQSPDGDSCNNIEDGIPLIGGPADLGLVFPQTTRWTNAPTKICKQGDIIVCVRATIGEPRWSDGIYCLGRGVAGIRPIDPNLDPQFLFRIIEGNEQELQSRGSGTTFKTISKQDLVSIVVPFIPREQQEAIGKFLLWLEQNGINNTRPDFSQAPTLPGVLSEQCRIVVRIEEVAAKIEEARGLRRNATTETDGIFDKMMSNYFSFEGSATTIGHYATVIGGYAFPSDYYTENGTHQIVRIGNVRDGYLDLSRAPVRWNLQNDSKISKYELSEGDILISMTGTRNKRDYGYIAMVPRGVKLLLNQRVGKIVLHDTERIDKPYFAYFLRSPFFRDHLFPNATGTANQANIGNKHIEDIPFIPPPLAEQKKIVMFLDNQQAYITKLKHYQAETSAELDALLPSILDKAFKAEL